MHISKSGVELFGRVSLLGEARGTTPGTKPQARLRHTRDQSEAVVSFLLLFFRSVASKGGTRFHGKERVGRPTSLRH